VKELASEPQVSPHSLSHFATRHALNGETCSKVPTGWSIRHCERHCGSALHAPRHVWYAEHTAAAAQAEDSSQQFVAAHDAQVLLPYGKPQALVGFPGGLSWMPTTCRQAYPAAIATSAVPAQVAAAHLRTQVASIAGRRSP
jgi:hypothetical protein